MNKSLTELIIKTITLLLRLSRSHVIAPSLFLPLANQSKPLSTASKSKQLKRALSHFQILSARAVLPLSPVVGCVLKLLRVAYCLLHSLVRSRARQTCFQRIQKVRKCAIRRLVRFWKLQENSNLNWVFSGSNRQKPNPARVSWLGKKPVEPEPTWKRIRKCFLEG